jgi:hypothetical protein
MSIELRVEGRLQETQMSCWWTAISTVLAYYGRRYRHPSAFSSAFERPMTRSPTSMGYEYQSIDDLMRGDPSLHSYRHDRLAPYEWYVQGLPNTGWGLRRLCELTGFQGVRDCPGYGEWSAADCERILRACGPLVFHGFWSGFGHSIVVCGVNVDGTNESVALMDPAVGFVSSETLANFNTRMNRMTIGLDAMGYNPIYYPTAEAVREVV